MVDLKNIITFGASGRVEKEMNYYNDLVSNLESINKIMEEKREILKSGLEGVIQDKKRAILSLKQIDKISKNLKPKDRDVLIYKVGDEISNIDFQYVNNTISAGEIAINASKSTAVGIGTALGAWALVGNLGVSSTGVAISSLSGAAATNATLAWLGGGSLAVGGGGMAAGTAVLAGIVAVPVVAMLGVFNHLKASQKIKEIKGMEIELISSIDNIKKNIIIIEATEKRCDELRQSLRVATKTFNKELSRTYKKIYPIPFLSHIFKKFKKNILNKEYFSRSDLENVSYIGKLAMDFAKIIDINVIE